MVSGKDSSNPLMADNLPKIVFYSTHHVTLMKSWLVQKKTAIGQTTTSKENSNPFMADSLPKIILLTFILGIKELASPKQTNLGKDISNSLIVDSLLKTIWLSVHHVIAMKHWLFQSKRLLKMNDVVRLQDLIDRQKVIITEDTTRQALHLDNAESIDCLPNEEIFTELARMGTAWNEFSSSIASAVICLATGRKFNFSKYIFDSLGSSVVDTPLFEGMLVQQVADDVANDVADDVDDGMQEECQAQVYHIDLEHANKVLSMQDDEPEPAELKEVKRKEKEDDAVLRYQALKRKPQTEVQVKKNLMVYLKNMARFKMDFFRGMSYDDIRPIFEKHFNSVVGFLDKSEVQLEEDASKALKRKSESSEQQAVKKKKFDEEVEELKKHLQIFSNDEDDVNTKASPLALKVPVVDYQIHTENNKPYYKVIRADGTHPLFLSFNLLRNFNREDLEVLWQTVQERFASSKPKNFSDDFLLNTLKAMFEKPDVEAHIWRNQKGIHGLVKFKSWKLLESCGVYIITFTSTQMILLVERRYPLKRFTLDQMLNNVRLEVEEESEVSLELLRFVRRQQQEGYRLDFGVDAVEDFKEYTLRDYYCWLKTYCCWYKLKLLDNVVDSRLRLLEESDVADDKMKK
nr:hypothetical protein [Tanacetum cinerariifolium]